MCVFGPSDLARITSYHYISAEAVASLCLYSENAESVNFLVNAHSLFLKTLAVSSSFDKYVFLVGINIVVKFVSL